MKIIISPLDWGLGHTTRIIPIIRFLRQKKHYIIVAANEQQRFVLKTEFPDLHFVCIKSYNVKYSTGKRTLAKIFLQIPKIILAIVSEHFQLKKYINKFNIDIIISDNRYGFFSKKKRSYFITHQISPKTGFYFSDIILNKIIKYFISKYNKCLVPDFDSENNLTGELNRKFSLPRNVKFIGILSDFKISQNKSEKITDITAIISGPEPQRAVFEKLIINIFKDLNCKSAIVSGTPLKQKQKSEKSDITFYNHLNRSEMQKIIEQSKLVICRSGYTSVMDLISINRTALLIPTPGQTEQIYLAKQTLPHFGFTYCEQNKLSAEIIKQNFGK